MVTMHLVLQYIAYPHDTKESFESSSRYMGENGFVNLLSVDIEEEDLMNNREPDEIEVEILIDAMETYIHEKRDKEGYNKE